MRPLLFSRSCLWFVPPSAVEQSKSQRVEELGSQPPTRSFGLQLGETVGHSWTSRLVDFPAPELSERTGGTTRRNTKYYERSQYVFDNTGSTLATKLKRTQNGANFERQMHRLNSNGELSREGRVRAGGLRLEMRKGTEAIRSRNPGAPREKYKNNTNEASMLLKTQGAFGKRTQNEPKNEPNLVCLRRELMPNSEVARLVGKNPLTWLATLATLSPGKRVLKRFGRVTPKQAMRENTRIGGTKRECL
jgi:hypothetical protein